MKKKIIALVLTVTVLVGAIVGGTIAYLADVDSDVNVMTMGNVYIEQLEYERVVDENGNWVASNHTGYGYTADLMQEFTQDKKAYPAVYRDGVLKWDDRNGSQEPSGAGSHQQPWSQIGAEGSNQLFDDSVKNVVDKFVFVENTGKSEAYYRTIIAIECPETVDPDLIHVNQNGHRFFVWNDLDEAVEFDGSRYLIKEAIYTQKLQPKEVSRPSLLQVYLDPEATNDDSNAFGDTWEIVVLSQAVQTEGFEGASDALASVYAARTPSDAEIALDNAYGDVTGDTCAEWFDGKVTEFEEYRAEATTPWDGTVDTTWYNDTDTEFTLRSEAQFAGLAELVDDGNTFEGKTIKLELDLDLKVIGDNGEPICFDPIGSYRNDQSFKGTFDGQGNTISNLYQNTWALDNGYYYSDCGLGFFGAVEGGTVKDVTFDGVEISGESGLCGVVAAVAHNATFENITVKNANCADYQYYAGGIVGWASGECHFVGCDIDATTNIAGQWGDFNNANGGIIGGISDSGTYYLENCNVACRIDAFNDVTSAYGWSSYRRSGMLVGDTGQMDDPDGNNVGNAIAPNVECKNVTVTYGEWANYTYCQFNNMSYPWVRVQEGVSTGAYSNPRYGHPTDANGNEVVDDNHVHADGEKHHELIVFDQLFGGATGDRYCTYGTATHDGVTVVYNNK